MKRFILLVTIIMCIALISCPTIKREEKIEVNATVSDMQYQSSYEEMVPIYNGKTTTLMPQTYPECYLVTISYEDVSETFDSKDLYESVKNGDTLKMILYKGYDKKDNLIKQTLLFPK